MVSDLLENVDIFSAPVSIFLRNHSPERATVNIRKLLMTYLINNGDCQPEFHGELLNDLEGVFQLLDSIKSAQKQ